MQRHRPRCGTTSLIFLAVEHDLAVYSKNLTGASMRPDQQFNLTEDADLK